MSSHGEHSSNREKGNLVEDIAREMYQLPGFSAQPRVKLEPIGGSNKRSEWREIDVLITLSVPGSPTSVRMAVECKNEVKPIPAEYIDSFASKLDDVGIPSSLGIYVSKSRYTSGAMRRARKLGMKTLQLVSDEPDQIPDILRKIVQPIVFLLLRIDSIRLEAGISIDNHGASRLRLADGRDGGLPIDLIWAAWLRGRPSSLVGSHELTDLPSYGRGHIVDGLFVPLVSISASVTVLGLMIDVPGISERHRLLDAKSGADEREHVRVEFPMRPGSYQVASAHSQDDLRAALRTRNPLNLPVLMFRLPRVAYGATLSPPTSAGAWKLSMLARAVTDGRISHSEAGPMLGQLERNDLSAAFDPIWSEYPALDLIPEGQDVEVRPI